LIQIKNRKIYPMITFTLTITMLLVFSIVLIINASGFSGKMNKEQRESNSAISELQKLKNEDQAMQINNSMKIKSSKASATLPNSKKNSSKVAYLTFDDGSSQYTGRLLNILKAKNVHATFFVVGTNVIKYQSIVKREHTDGNAVGIHCWNHSYSVVYASQNAFFIDFNHIKDTLTNLLGVSPNVCHFPGGTGNTVSDKYQAHFMRKVLSKVTVMGIKPFDWDVYAGDADSKPATTQNIIDTVIKEAKAYNHPVILCHDTKKNTIDAIPSIIAHLKSLGYSFGILSSSAPSCQQKPV
jgi:peptidoglycan-N-acetylglucosamine deacetylase